MRKAMLVAAAMSGMSLGCSKPALIRQDRAQIRSPKTLAVPEVVFVRWSKEHFSDHDVWIANFKMTNATGRDLDYVASGDGSPVCEIEKISSGGWVSTNSVLVGKVIRHIRNGESATFTRRLVDEGIFRIGVYFPSAEPTENCVAWSDPIPVHRLSNESTK